MNQSPPVLPPAVARPPRATSPVVSDAFKHERLPAWIRSRPWLQRPLVAITGVSISAKVMGIVLALTILFGLAMIIQVRLIMVNALQSELHSNGLGVASDLADHAAPLLAANDATALTTHLRDTLDNHPDIRYAFVLDTQQRVVASAQRSDNGAIESGVVIPEDVVAIHAASAAEEASHLDYAGADGLIHDFVVSIQPHTNGHDEIGSVRLGLVELRLNERISSATDQIWLTTLVIAGLGVLAAMLLTWLLTRPILDLVTTTEQLRKGNLSVRAPHWTDDEIGALSEAFNLMISELETSQQTLIEKEKARTHLLSRLISAQEEERKRIARELHDSVGQALTSILVHIKVLAQDQEPAARARMSELHQLVNETLTDVRMLSRELRPSALDDLGLEAALERYIAEFNVRYPNLQTDLHCALSRRLPPNVETSLYRIIQEAMTNTARHSQATNLSIVVQERAGVVHAIIEDNGTGFDVESRRRAGSSVGLHSMIERSELLEGSLDVESSKEGTTVYVEIPLAQSYPIVPSET